MVVDQHEDDVRPTLGRIAYAPYSEVWELAVWGRNLTDEDRFATLFANAGGQLVAYPVRGREVGVSATVRF